MRYQTLIDALPAEVALMDHTGAIYAVNKKWNEKVSNGISTPFYIGCGMNYFELLQAMNRVEDIQGLYDVLNGKKAAYAYVYQYKSREQAPALYELAFTPLLNETLGTGVMISHKEANCEAHTGKAVLAPPSVPFVILEPDGTISYVNSEAEILFQYPRLFLAGKKIPDLFPRILELPALRLYKQAFELKQPFALTECFPLTDHSYCIHMYPHHNGGAAVFFHPAGREQKIRERVERFAFIDHLTGIGNRRMISMQLQECEETEQPFSLFCLNIDQFKHFNEVYGYERGDEALIHLARKLEETVPDSCRLARIGADEFAVFVSEALSVPRLEELAHSLLAAASAPIPLKDLPSAALKVNIGIVSSDDETVTASSALDQANMAVKTAKSSPSSAYQLFKKDIQDELVRLRDIEQELRRIEIGRDFYLVFQPQVDARSEKIIGFECLSRWTHPLYGSISPAEFIHIAEEKLFIYSLTEKIIDYTFNILKKWKQSYRFDGIISINLSSFLLEHERFIDFVGEKLKEFGLDPAQIEFEITESVQLFSSEKVTGHLRKLRASGIRISIDDFGTGYAALSYLSNFPVDKLKIDKHFIDQIQLDLNGEAVLETIILMAEKLKLQYIAEGVETAIQLDFLKLHGCSHIQGYYFYKPMPEADCESLLAAPLIS